MKINPFNQRRIAYKAYNYVEIEDNFADRDWNKEFYKYDLIIRDIEGDETKKFIMSFYLNYIEKLDIVIRTYIESNYIYLN